MTVTSCLISAAYLYVVGTVGCSKTTSFWSGTHLVAVAFLDFMLSGL